MKKAWVLSVKPAENVKNRNYITATRRSEGYSFLYTSHRKRLHNFSHSASPNSNVVLTRIIIWTISVHSYDTLLTQNIWCESQIKPNSENCVSGSNEYKFDFDWIFSNVIFYYKTIIPQLK